MQETFGQRFARLRKARGRTQEEIAQKVNVTPQAVSKWENDISSPDILLLGELADLLDVSLDVLLGRTPQETAFVPAEERKDIKKMMLKIIVDSVDGDKVRINLPMALVELYLSSGLDMPEVKGNKALANLDLEQIFKMVEQGVIGELMTVESNDGDTVRIVVE